MKRKSNKIENRKAFRAPTILRVDYHTSDSSYIEFAGNVSAGGLFIATGTPLKPGTYMVLEIQGPESKHPVRVKAKVMWNRTRLTSMDQKRGMGVQFEDIDESTKEKIKDIVKRLRSNH